MAVSWPVELLILIKVDDGGRGGEEVGLDVSNPAVLEDLVAFLGGGGLALCPGGGDGVGDVAF